MPKIDTKLIPNGQKGNRLFASIPHKKGMGLGWLLGGKENEKSKVTDFVRLLVIGDALVSYVASGKNQTDAPVPAILKSASRGEIRAGLIEVCIDRLNPGLSFKDQIKLVENIGILFWQYVGSFDLKTERSQGTREPETKELRDKVSDLWDLFQDLIVKDDGRRFEINKAELREKIYPSLLQMD